MDIQAAAGIEIFGRALRYAEVEHENGHHRLLRLGSCSFDFDVVDELIRRDSPQHLGVVTEALQDVLSGATSRHLRMAVHPPDAYAFTTAVPSALDAQARQKRLEEETALLIGQPEAAQLQVSAQATHAVAPAADKAEPVDWTQALALPHVVRGRAGRILRALPHHTHEWGLSTKGAARIARWTEAQNAAASDMSAPFALVVGWYGAHVEYVVLHEGAWYYGHHAETESTDDSVYFATALLHRLDISIADVGRVYLYGQNVDLDAFGSLRAVFDTSPRVLDPLAVVGLSPEELDNHFEPEEYAPCIGVAL